MNLFIEFVFKFIRPNNEKHSWNFAETLTFFLASCGRLKTHKDLIMNFILVTDY